MDPYNFRSNPLNLPIDTRIDPLNFPFDPVQTPQTDYSALLKQYIEEIIYNFIQSGIPYSFSVHPKILVFRLIKQYKEFVARNIGNIPVEQLMSFYTEAVQFAFAFIRQYGNLYKIAFISDATLEDFHQEELMERYNTPIEIGSDFIEEYVESSIFDKIEFLNQLI